MPALNNDANAAESSNKRLLQLVLLLIKQQLTCMCALWLQLQFLCINKHSPGACIKEDKQQTMTAHVLWLVTGRCMHLVKQASFICIISH
jgi:hypothetical protein